MTKEFIFKWIVIVGLGLLWSDWSLSSTPQNLKFDHNMMQLLGQPAGKADFFKTFHDLGSVYRGEILRVTFGFRNVGKGPLMFQGVHASCGCTAVSLPENRSFQPNETGEIHFIVDTTDYIGNFEKKVSIMTNAAKDSVHNLTIKANIKAEIEVDPPIVDFESVAGEMGSHRTIYLKSLRPDQPLKIENIEYDKNKLDIAYHQIGSEWIIDLFLRPGLTMSHIKENLIIVSNAQHLKRLPLPVRADIVSKIKHEPQYIEFGAVPYQSSVVKTIQLRSNNAFKILNQKAELHVNGKKVEDFSRYIQFLPVDQIDESGQQNLGIRLVNQDESTGSVFGRVVLETSDQSQKNLSIKFYAFFQE